MPELVKGMEINLGISWCFSNPGSVVVKFRGQDIQSKWISSPRKQGNFGAIVLINK